MTALPFFPLTLAPSAAKSKSKSKTIEAVIVGASGEPG